MSKANFEIMRADYKSVLKDAFEGNKFEHLTEKQKQYVSPEHDVKSPLDQSFRDLLLEFIEQQVDIEIYKKYVRFCIEACRKGLTSSTMPVVLLGDIFDTLTLTKCEALFEFVEEGVLVWKEELFFVSCKNNLLRMCNDLLRRLSRSQNNVFCGRVLLFLAKFFPFSERSGLNIVSEFNLDNITEYGKEGPEAMEQKTEDTEGEEKKVSIDYNMYCKFWSLQDYFRNPNQCYNKVQWKTFVSHSSSVLAAFNSSKLEEVSAPVESKERRNYYYTKYLTSPKLLELQLSDYNFRRYILVQFLILFQYLNSPVKMKSDVLELKPDQTEWINNQTELVYNLLKETPPGKEDFAKAIKHIMQREERWNTWKKDGCPEFKRPATVAMADEPPVKKRTREPRPPKLFGDLIKDAAKKNQYYMANNELTRLWNLCPNNLESCKAKERDFLPSLDNYFAEAIEQSDPTAMVEDEYKKVNDPNFGWRALRLLARRSPQFFTYSNNPISKLSEYLDMMIKKLAKDRTENKNNTPQESNNEVLMQQDNEVEEELMKANDEMTQSKPANSSQQPVEVIDLDADKRASVNITIEQLNKICDLISARWKDVASQFGYKPDEIAFFESENETDFERAKNVLQIWLEDEAESSLDRFFDVLDWLEMTDVTETIKKDLGLN